MTRAAMAMARLLALGCALPALVVACGWDPSRPFDRQAPPVERAIRDLDAGDAAAATASLEDYLSTGSCKDGNIGTPDGIKKRPDGTFDLGLSLFRIGEHFGRRFGEEEIDAGVSGDTRDQRHAQVECARRLVEIVGSDPAASAELRTRAHYLEGNLAFLDGAYEDAVRAYDEALVLAPGVVDGGDEVGRDAAYNRAIALRRIEDRKDAGSDAAPPDASRDGSSDASSSPDAGSGPKDASSGGQDASKGGEDAGHDAAEPQDRPDAAPEPPPEAGAQPPPPSTNEDERMLDQLENAPTLQQEEAKRSGKKRVRGMADK
jgi:hypothetical protein